MSKNLILLISLFSILTAPLLISAQGQRVSQHNLGQVASVSPQARQALNALYQLPEFRELLMQVQQEGPVRIKVESHPKFEGLWDGNSRSIVINGRLNPTLGQMICTILFELHNAATASYYDRLIEEAERGEMTKDQYVERVEHAEYQNARHTYELLEKGIKMGIFPASARWPVTSSFDEHYKVQQISGHSLFIADAYDQIYPMGRGSKFRGTIQRPTWLGERDKEEFCRYVLLRAGLDSENPDKYRHDLQVEISHLQNSFNKKGSRDDVERASRRIEMLKIAMKGSPDYSEATEHLPFMRIT